MIRPRSARSGPLACSSEFDRDFPRASCQAPGARAHIELCVTYALPVPRPPSNALPTRRCRSRRAKLMAFARRASSRRVTARLPCHRICQRPRDVLGIRQPAPVVSMLLSHLARPTQRSARASSSRLNDGSDVCSIDIARRFLVRWPPRCARFRQRGRVDGRFAAAL
jgi:hypothetical protein